MDVLHKNHKLYDDSTSFSEQSEEVCSIKSVCSSSFLALCRSCRICLLGGVLHNEKKQARQFEVQSTSHLNERVQCCLLARSRCNTLNSLDPLYPQSLLLMPKKMLAGWLIGWMAGWQSMDSMDSLDSMDSNPWTPRLPWLPPISWIPWTPPPPSHPHPTPPPARSSK